MSKVNKPLQIPFDADGQMQGYASSPSEWKDNHDFDATLFLDNSRRGRSSVKFHFYDQSGNAYEMFVKDFVDMCKRTNVEKGKVEGTFCFAKRGQNYGIKLK